MILNLFGTFSFDRDPAVAVPTITIAAALSKLFIAEGAVRVTLHRMARRGLISASRNGSLASYQLSEGGIRLLTRGRERMFKPDPFNCESDGWTLLVLPAAAFSGPKRYSVQTRLQWAGFGTVDSRVWLAPSRIDVPAVLADVFLEESFDTLVVLHGDLVSPTRPDALISQVWNLDDIRVTHLAFIEAWESFDRRDEPLVSLLRLVHQWSQLLLKDPGLAGAAADPLWPASRSSRCFTRLYRALRDPACEEFDQLNR